MKIENRSTVRPVSVEEHFRSCNRALIVAEKRSSKVTNTAFEAYVSMYIDIRVQKSTETFEKEVGR